MDPRVATSDSPAKDPNMPPMIRVGEVIAPKAPAGIAASGLDENVLIDLTMRLSYTVARFNTEWVCKQLHFSLPLAQEVLEKLSHEGLLEETLRTNATSSH